MDNVVIDLDEFIENLRLFDFTDIQINKIIKAINKTIQKNSYDNEIGRGSLLQQIKRDNTDFPYFKVGTKALIDKEMLDEWIRKIVKEHRGI